jgi:hypothetical protein
LRTNASRDWKTGSDDLVALVPVGKYWLLFYSLSVVLSKVLEQRNRSKENMKKGEE